jgi:hypothetical protein
MRNQACWLQNSESLLIDRSAARFPQNQNVPHFVHRAARFRQTGISEILILIQQKIVRTARWRARALAPPPRRARAARARRAPRVNGGHVYIIVIRNTHTRAPRARARAWRRARALRRRRQWAAGGRCSRLHRPRCVRTGRIATTCLHRRFSSFTPCCQVV